MRRLFNIGLMAIFLCVSKPAHAVVVDDQSFLVIIGLAASMVIGGSCCLLHACCLKLQAIQNYWLGYFPYEEDGWEMQKSHLGAAYKICRWNDQFSIANTNAFLLKVVEYPREGGGNLFPIIKQWWRERELRLPDDFLAHDYDTIEGLMIASAGKKYRLDRAVMKFTPLSEERDVYDVDFFLMGGIHAHSRGLRREYQNLYMDFDLNLKVAQGVTIAECCGSLWQEKAQYTQALKECVFIESIANEFGVVRLFFTTDALPNARYIVNVNMRFDLVIKEIFGHPDVRYWELKR